MSVKSSRLLSILLLLQNRGRMTGAQLVAKWRSRYSEVLEPPQLRARLAATARALAIRYASDEHGEGD